MENVAQVLLLEIRAARIAATLDARPALGALWRRMVGLSESAASLSLEMIIAKETDIIRPPLGLSTIKGEPQSARTAREIYRTTLRPGSINDDPLGVFDRCVEATRVTDVIDDGDGGYVYYPIDVEVQAWGRGREMFKQMAPRIIRDRPPPILGAVAVARLASSCMPDPHPMTERLIFMAAEHELRRDIVLSDPVVSSSLNVYESKIDASWVCPPSLALARGGLRSWALDRPQMRNQLFERLHLAIGREIGRLGPLNAWAEKLENEFTGKIKSSSRKAFAKLIMQTPILDGSSTAAALDLTERGARNLLTDAEKMGLVTEITSRTSYRMWAVPVFADMIYERGTLSRHSAQKEGVNEKMKSQKHTPLADDPDFENRIAAIMSDIDSAMTGLDDVLEKYKPQRTRP
ncbi:hypothetical protein ACOI1H_22030 [Loktanella sp. DJP18]|uniref:hypothetical protein n=1 Tax=Loktanella sp. DJP18 TaxID=3409788 RepID=UPI003BB57D1A